MLRRCHGARSSPPPTSTGAQERLRQVYGRIRLDEPRARTLPVRMSRIDVGCFSTTDLTVPAEFDAHVAGHHELVINTLISGTVRLGDDTVLGAGAVSLGNFPGADHRRRGAGVHTRSLHLPAALVLATAAGLEQREGEVDGASLRFLSIRPVDAAAQARWRRTTAFVDDLLRSRGEPPGPLVIANAACLLAATVLGVFPHSLTADVDSEHDGRDPGPALLRRAVAYIEQHHANPNLTMADIAAAVRVTPRTVQYAFRSQLVTTPMNYLRRVRLARAHEELRRADPTTTTVTAVAARWGFLHPGRFAFYYRQAYRTPPSATLHSGSGVD